MRVTVCVDSEDRTFAGAAAAVFNSDPNTDFRILDRYAGGGDDCVAVVSVGRLESHRDIDLPLIVVDRALDEGRFVDALEAGATAYTTEAEFLERGADICREVIKGNAVVPPRLLGVLLRQVILMRRQARDAEGRLSRLTPREREVFGLAAQGLGRSDIAGALFVSVGTVRTHMQRIFRKLDVHSQAELAAFAALAHTEGRPDD